MDGGVESELIVSPPVASPAKSPPRAFVPPSADSPAPHTSSPRTRADPDSSISPPPAGSAMGLTVPQAHDLQVILNQQTNAIQLLHDAFAAERQVWNLEKERLYQRIASLEHLLRTQGHYSPAKSPAMSPSSGSSITSPPSRATASAPRLPIIAEDGNIQPLSRRRIGAPQSIVMSGQPPVSVFNGGTAEWARREGSVSFSRDVKVDEVPISPPTTAKRLSPPLVNKLAMAGHTPLKAPRPPTPPPKDMVLEGVEDTPTRNNTHINAFLTQSNDDEEDIALKGPLNMPELPSKPDENNFTLDALSKRLELIERDPEEGRPLVFAEASPGLASPADPMDKDSSPKTADKSIGNPAGCDGSISQSDRSSNAASPTAATMSPNGAQLSPQQSHELQVHQDFEQGGIKLKKKPSTNFGAPFGQLVPGLGAMRKLS